jgi:prefoldin subunit 5
VLVPQPDASNPEGAQANYMPLEIHQLSSASNSLKVRIAKARSSIAELPDISRSVEEQEEEIAELERRIEGSRSVLVALGGLEWDGKEEDGDAKMEG